ncbi:hypothetical protein [Mangrovihabitans endophyticus]|uniref:Uncharacterized protein n=1 Tax=Mangrovihabitans endophyticus TaxID=1751298 RepID=A0A8J3FR55_9ACTN|nr:hypothetical protein [Mangrovihabitans endophyticus]GGL06613.1 hypothetical protein GCM10012284_46130 [Mangrovihabitans endophyticus]
MRLPSALTAAAGMLAAAVTVAGCGDLGESAAAQGIARNDLISEVATQLGTAQTLTYSATYRLADGQTASIAQAQRPRRTALVHPGGRWIVTDDAVTTCVQQDRDLDCTITTRSEQSPTDPAASAAAAPSATAGPASGEPSAPGPSSAGPSAPGPSSAGPSAPGPSSGPSAPGPSSGPSAPGPSSGPSAPGPSSGPSASAAGAPPSSGTGGVDAEAVAEAARTGMIMPATVLALLNAAALDSDVDVEQHDTTIAGHHATCITLDRVVGGPIARFGACVTTEGALGSFTGVLDGKTVDVAMTHYSDRTDSDAFVPPRYARTVDHRNSER